MLDFINNWHLFPLVTSGQSASLPRATDPDLIQGSLNQLFEFDTEDEVQKEDLFKLKLKMFEQPQVEKSKKQKLKADLRKAISPIEAAYAYAKF